MGYLTRFIILVGLICLPVSGVIVSFNDTYSTGVDTIASSTTDPDDELLLLPPHWEKQASDFVMGVDRGHGYDDNLLGDGDDDGYLLFNSLAGPSSNVTAWRNLGLIEEIDVARGKPITLSFAFLNVSGGFNARARLLVGSSVVDEVKFTTFGGNPQLGVINLMYTIAVGDIGKNLYFEINYYASSSGTRDMAIDQLTVVTP